MTTDLNMKATAVNVLPTTLAGGSEGVGTASGEGDTTSLDGHAFATVLNEQFVGHQDAQPRAKTVPVLQGGDALPVPVSQDGDALPVPLSQGSGTLPVPVLQGGDALPVPLSQSGDALPVPLSQGGDALPVPLSQSGDALPVPLSQSGDALPVPLSQGGDALPVPLSQGGDALPPRGEQLPRDLDEPLSGLTKTISSTNEGAARPPTPLPEPELSNSVLSTAQEGSPEAQVEATAALLVRPDPEVQQRPDLIVSAPTHEALSPKGRALPPERGRIGERQLVIDATSHMPPPSDNTLSTERGAVIELGRQPMVNTTTYFASPAEGVALTDHGSVDDLGVRPVIPTPSQTLLGLSAEGATRVIDEAPELQVPFRNPGWDQALGSRLQWMVGKGVQSASLQLNPADLGPVSVQLSINQDQASVSFVSQHVAVREAIEAALPRLSDMLSGSGLNLADVDIADEHHTPGGGEHESADENADLKQHWTEESDDMPPAESAGPSIDIRHGLVDTFV